MLAAERSSRHRWHPSFLGKPHRIVLTHRAHGLDSHPCILHAQAYTHTTLEIMAKRQASVQLTKDDYEREDDEDRYGPPIVPGTWQKADEETLKMRVIRKAKRPTPSGAGSSLPMPPGNPFASLELTATAPATNPFANVQLTAPAPAANPFASVQLLPGKAQRTSTQSSIPFTYNPFVVQPMTTSTAATFVDPGVALREHLHAVRLARLHML